MPCSSSSDVTGMNHCIPKLPPAREVHGASAQFFFSERAVDTREGDTKDRHGRGCYGKTAGDTDIEKNYAATGGLQPLEDLHWSKDQ